MWGLVGGGVESKIEKADPLTRKVYLFTLKGLNLYLSESKSNYHILLQSKNTKHVSP